MVHTIWFAFIVVSISVHQGLCENEYIVQFSSGIDSCPDFQNDMLDTSNMVLTKKKSEDEDEPDLMCMEGSIKIKSKIESGVMINLVVEKETDIGNDPVFTWTLGFCESLSDENSPCKEMFEELGITECPVDVIEIIVKELLLLLGFLNDYLTHEYCADYFIRVEFVDELHNCLSCHVMSASISEK